MKVLFLNLQLLELLLGLHLCLRQVRELCNESSLKVDLKVKIEKSAHLSSGLGPSQVEFRLQLPDNCNLNLDNED